MRVKRSVPGRNGRGRRLAGDTSLAVAHDGLQLRVQVSDAKSAIGQGSEGMTCPCCLLCRWELEAPLSRWLTHTLYWLLGLPHKVAARFQE